MGIRISERSDFFHVPFGPPNSEGTREDSFIDLKANPEWIAVLPSCVGWPETQQLLQVINAPTSQFMSLAADQAFLEPQGIQLHETLTSFVTICFADVETNSQVAILALAEFLNQRVDQRLQEASNALQHSLNLEMVIERQPTKFHHVGFEGWSLTTLIAASGIDRGQARNLWKLCMKTLSDVIEEWEINRKKMA